MEHMIMGILARGEGFTVIDPHGDLIERLLCLMPESALERIIYFSFKDPDWIPIWNPLQGIPGQDVGRTADDMVDCIHSVVSGWGDRMEHLLRHGIFALLHMPRAAFIDINRLLARQPEERRRYKNEILKVIENEAARQFWLHEFESYRPDEFGPPSHKLSKWLVGGNVSLMLSQPDSFFNFRDMMDRGMIFLADLSTLGSEVRNLLGGFMLSQFHLAALSRSDVPIARIGTDIFRIKIPKLREIPARHFRDRIIAQSHERYYKPFADVRKLVRQNIAPWESPHVASVSPPPTPAAAAEEALTYDEF